MIDFSKRIIVDFDDTLIFHNGIDIEYATPNNNLINKLKSLQLAGFFITVCTARGSISCKNRKAAEEKYRDKILKVLKKFDFTPNELSFNKELGIAYIDDKAWRPEVFENVEFHQFKNGYSGNSIYRLGDLVIKTDKNATLHANWLTYSGYDCPQVVSVIHDTITMKHINDSEKLTDVSDRPELLNKVLSNIITNYNKENWMLETCVDFGQVPDVSTYISKVLNHIDNIPAYNKMPPSKQIRIIRGMNNRLHGIIANIKYSNFHGDLSCENILVQSDNTVFYIDPIVDYYVWYSSILDAAKLAASFKLYTTFDYSNIIYDKIKDIVDISFESFEYLIACELLRTYKYRKTQTEKNYVYFLIKDILGLTYD